LGVDGISATHGLSAHSEHEAGITLAMSSRANLTYVLCDSTKIGKNSYLQFGSLQLIDVLITDKETEETRLLKEAGIKILS
jgi:DeoR family fructose operon transcriptional repressor